MLFNTIQTIDREKLVKEIVKVRLKTQTKTEYFYIQINIGEENQKSGIPLNETLDFYKFCIDNSLQIKGFMCIPPINNNPEYYFNKMLILGSRFWAGALAISAFAFSSEQTSFFNTIPDFLTSHEPTVLP